MGAPTADQWRYWHYTVGSRLLSIVENGIRPATALVPENVRPITWFTTADHWEETANKGTADEQFTRQQTHERCGGLVRIGISDRVPLHQYSELMQLSKESSSMIAALREVAEDQGSNPVRDWFGTFDVVPPSVFDIIEIWDGEKWDGSKWREAEREAQKAAAGGAG